MTGLLTAAAALTLITLFVSAVGTISRATPSDPLRRGSWGIVRFTSNRSRPLNLHERRWQTSILAGKDTNSRWRDLVTEIETLEYLGNVTRSTPAPETYNSAWVEEALTRLEAAVDEKKQPGDRQ